MVKKLLKAMARPILGQMIGWVNRHPQVKESVILWIGRWPALDARLRRFSAGRKQHGGNIAGATYQRAHPGVPLELLHEPPQMSAVASRVYRDLSRLCEQRNERVRHENRH